MTLPEEYRERRGLALCEFVRAHDLDPNDVPEDSSIDVHGDKVTFTIVERDAAGNMIADGDSVKRKTVTVDKVCEYPTIS